MADSPLKFREERLLDVGEMASKKKTAEQHALELKYRFRIKVLDVIGAIFNNGIKFGLLAYCAYLLRGGLIALAGRTTIADLGLTLVGNITITESVELTVTVGAVAYATWERKVRYDKTEYLASRLKEYETRLDPGRSSSKLMPTGTTRPEDRE